MNENRPPHDSRANDLRQQAEGRVDPASVDISSMTIDEVAALVHELQVHQIELEMQADQLRASEQALVEARDEYLNLYEFAPVGYMSIDTSHRICRANLTAARLLNKDRRSLIGQRVEQVFSSEFRDACYCTLREAWEKSELTSRELGFERSDGRQGFLQVDILQVHGERDDSSELRIGLIDITARTEAEAEREQALDNLREAMGRIKMLQRLLPVCASCRRVRDNEGNWKQIEAYISEHSETQFSHTVCPSCARELYPEMADDVFGPEG
jgi:PAS domain S-box-containing protein